VLIFATFAVESKVPSSAEIDLNRRHLKANSRCFARPDKTVLSVSRPLPLCESGISRVVHFFDTLCVFLFPLLFKFLVFEAAIYANEDVRISKSNSENGGMKIC